MKTMTWEGLFGPITGKKNPRLSLKKAEWHTLVENCWFNGYEYKEGSHYKFFETENFGYVVFRGDSRTPEGSIPGKFIHRF